MASTPPTVVHPKFESQFSTSEICPQRRSSADERRWMGKWEMECTRGRGEETKTAREVADEAVAEVETEEDEVAAEATVSRERRMARSSSLPPRSSTWKPRRT